MLSGTSSLPVVCHPALSASPHFSNYWRIGPPNQAKVILR